MEEKIKELRAAIEQASAAVTDKAQLSDFWQKYLSKNGEVAGLTKSLRDVPKEDRPAVGKTINEFKQWAEKEYQALSEQVEKAALVARNAAETVDITMPAKIRPTACCIPSPSSRTRSLTCSPVWALKFTKAPRSRTTTTTSPA